MMFSGHTSITVALSLVVLISYSGNVRFKLLEMGFKVVVFLMMCAELLLIVWTRRHYTMDVGVGVIVSLSLVGVYYGTLLSAMVHQSLSSSKLSHDLKKIRAPLVFGPFPFIFKLIRWMDGADH